MFENFLTHCLFLLRICEYEKLEDLIYKQIDFLTDDLYSSLNKLSISSFLKYDFLHFLSLILDLLENSEYEIIEEQILLQRGIMEVM